MKLLLATVALATVIAAPAFAQGTNHKGKAHLRSGEASAQAQYGRTEGTSRHSSNPANDVYDTAGRYLGSDPDPRVRMDLRNDTAAD